MAWLATKYLITAALVVLVSEAAKRSDKLGGFLGALPLVTILTLVWLHVEGQPEERVGKHAYYTFWYVLPTLPMFLAFPWLLPRVGFWVSLVVSGLGAVAVFALAALALRRIGVELLP